MAQSLQSKTTSKLADRLAAVRHGRFVGRETELALFRSVLLAEQTPFVVLHIYGPGGVGKTTLLPLMERVGVATAVDVQIETLADRLRQEALANNVTLVAPPFTGAWANFSA